MRIVFLITPVLVLACAPPLEPGPDLEPDPDVETLSIDFTSGFIFDGDRWQDDVPYRLSEPSGLNRTQPGFTGTLPDGRIIPASDAVETMTYALRFEDAPDSAYILIEQDSFADAQLSRPSSPMAEIIFPSDAIDEGSHAIEAAGSGLPGTVILAVFDVQADGSTCIAAVGHGANLAVTRARDTILPDGGSLSISASSVPMYAPADTPAGDITGELDDNGLTACP